MACVFAKKLVNQTDKYFKSVDLESHYKILIFRNI